MKQPTWPREMMPRALTLSGVLLGLAILPGIEQCCETDNDGDGYSQCGSPDEADCDDQNAEIHPGATEICDSLDNDCDDDVDEGGMFWYADADGDGFGTLESSLNSCESPGTGYTTVSGDCDDQNSTTNPGQTEICDGLDNDCSGAADDGTQTMWYPDLDDDGFGVTEEGVSSCESPGDSYAMMHGDCDDTNQAIFPGQEEVCDELDNNCDGEIDEGVEILWYPDQDGDSYGNGEGGVLSCGIITVDAEGNAMWGPPYDGYTPLVGDCNDGDANFAPYVLETCDQLDNNCDGNIDESTGEFWYPDEDSDGYGVPGGEILSCNAPTYQYVNNDDDCDDTNAAINPSTIEVCDEIDNDCDGLSDEDTGPFWYPDQDGDGYYGSDAVGQQNCTNTAIGYVSIGGDCDDSNANLNPGEVEVCDEVDNDCDRIVDDGLMDDYYEDSDDDDQGNPLVPVQICVDKTTSQKAAMRSQAGMKLV